ncbi:MAG: hypothetical protein JSV90_00800 [Methanobacteriota archaeon]|nr:MAG: hypothetical protein JSV90_00800 [Euryarchaeota archaeon]
MALAGVILLILSLAFFVFYYELFLDHVMDLRSPREYGDIDLMNNLAKAYLYSMMIGEICVVLAILLLVYGSLMRQRLDMGLPGMAHLPLSRIGFLIVLALACMTTAFVLRLLYMEAWIDLDMEWWLRIQELTTVLHLAAWVFVSVVLFIVARRMQHEVKSSE